MVMIFIFFFGATNTASPYAYTAEILPTKIHASGMAIALFCANAITLIFTQTAPIALATIGWKFDLVFIACNVVLFPIVLIFFPEVRNWLFRYCHDIRTATDKYCRRRVSHSKR